ncbi:MAG: hypothetical protein H0V70_30005 [Ktedonobacteraceae bacterium]|nr:hypothetical protein [Ktedonobacteraceae bacterium]
MKKLLLIISLLVALLFTSIIPATAYAASQTPKAPVISQGRVPIHWQNGVGGCGLIYVYISSADGAGYEDCFDLNPWDSFHPSTYGYLGLGDPGGPGNVVKAFNLKSALAAPSGWIRYYGGRYPGGTYCKFNTGQNVNFLPSEVFITQIALNVSNSYHVCP